MSSKKFLIGSVLVVLLALILSVMVYATNEEGRYYSYTKAIKYCGADVCMMQDFTVYCMGDRVIDIKPMASHFYVPRDFEWDDRFGWCEY